MPENEIKNINVKDIEYKLRIIAWLESLRWKNQEINKNDIVYDYYCNDDLFKLENLSSKNIEKRRKTAEAILLTHYLVYICDRQMPYEEIFKAGGYTISVLTKNFIEKREEILNSINIREYIRNLIKGMIEAEKKNNKNDNSSEKYSYYLCCEIKNDEKNQIKKYFEYKSMSEKAKFSSRFMVTDLLCIYRTLVYLCEKFDGSFSKFLNYAIGKKDEKPIVYNKETKNKLYSLAYSMYKLTYQLIPQVKGNKEDICEILHLEEQGIIGTDKKINKYLSKIPKENSDKNDEKYDKLWCIGGNNKVIANDYSFYKKKHNSKRLWCVTRDFIFHPVFSKCFEIITGEKANDLQKNNVSELELPGDVWNNNLKFAQCFWFSNKNYNQSEFGNIKNSSVFIRNLYENEKLSNWKNNNKMKCYPKDFDITFNFVPNMCAKNKCARCPLNTNNNFNLSEYCHKQEGKLCTFVLYATGLEHICEGSCELLNIQNNNKKSN